MSNTKTGPKTLIIDRSKWARAGADKGQSRMLNAQGNMCCLGFYAKSCGVPAHHLASVGTPEGVFGHAPDGAPEEMLWLWYESRNAVRAGRSEESCALMEANDSLSKTDAEREAFITETFAKHGVDVIFVDQVTPADKGPTELVIDRSKWARAGAGKGNSRLLNDEGNMCCLGFYSAACGVEPGTLLGNFFPHSGRVYETGLVPSWLTGENAEAGLDLADVNDSPSKTAEEREAFIKTEFAKHGVAVTFVSGNEDVALGAPLAPATGKAPTKPGIVWQYKTPKYIVKSVHSGIFEPESFYFREDKGPNFCLKNTATRFESKAAAFAAIKATGGKYPYEALKVFKLVPKKAVKAVAA